MPLGTTNISSNGIQTEFGGSTPIALSSYYRNGSFVGTNPSTLDMSSFGYTAPVGGSVSTSGPISMGSFRSSSKRFSITRTISSTTSDYNLYNDIPGIALMTSPLDISLIVNAGVTVYATSTSTYAITIPNTFPAGTKISLYNYGNLWASGGNGGKGSDVIASSCHGTNGDPGGAGGDVINAQWNNGSADSLTLYNYGVISAGGGGGGGGGTSTFIAAFGEEYSAQGGGGAGGRGYSSSGGARGCYFFNFAYTRGSGTDGTGGTTSSAGTPGIGGFQFASGASTPSGFGSAEGGSGGAGGNRGSVGIAGGTPTTPAQNIYRFFSGGAGGAAGRAIVGNNLASGRLTVSVVGEIYGAY